MCYVCFSDLLAVDGTDYVQLLSTCNTESSVVYMREITGPKPLAALSLKQNKSQEPTESQQAGFSLAESRMGSLRVYSGHNLKDEEAESNKDVQV